MKYLLPFCGIILPGLDQEVYFPKQIMSFYAIISYFTIMILTSFSRKIWVQFKKNLNQKFPVLNYGSLFFGPQNNFEISAYYFIVGSNASCGVIRFILIKVYKKDVEQVVSQLNRNFLKPMQSKSRQVSFKKNSDSFYSNSFYSLALWKKSECLIKYFTSMLEFRNWLHLACTFWVPGDRNDLKFLIPLVIYGYLMGTSYAFG